MEGYTPGETQEVLDKVKQNERHVIEAEFCTVQLDTFEKIMKDYFAPLPHSYIDGDDIESQKIKYLVGGPNGKGSVPEFWEQARAVADKLVPSLKNEAYIGVDYNDELLEMTPKELFANIENAKKQLIKNKYTA